jgi:hypothetical protein
MAYDPLAGPGPPATWFGQHAFDHIVADILRTQIFDGRHGIAALLERNTEVDDVALVRIAPLVGNERFVVVLVKNILIHRSPDFDGDKGMPLQEYLPARAKVKLISHEFMKPR